MSSVLSSSTSTGLLERVKNRDPEAWRRFARLYTPLVYRWARQCNLQSNDAADVVQEVFVAVARSIDRFRHDQPQSSFRGWLWTITRNQVRLHYRRGSDRPETLGGSDANYVFQTYPDLVERDAEPADANEHACLVHRAVELIRGDFQPQTWQAFWRLAVEGRPVAEVAEELGMTAAAVRQAKYRVLCRLHEELSGL
jgi:RNA polymerase sigma-70 factor (ECF subfamily)